MTDAKEDAMRRLKAAVKSALAAGLTQVDLLDVYRAVCREASRRTPAEPWPAAGANGTNHEART